MFSKANLQPCCELIRVYGVSVGGGTLEQSTHTRSRSDSCVLLKSICASADEHGRPYAPSAGRPCNLNETPRPAKIVYRLGVRTRPERAFRALVWCFGHKRRGVGLSAFGMLLVASMTHCVRKGAPTADSQAPGAVAPPAEVSPRPHGSMELEKLEKSAFVPISLSEDQLRRACRVQAIVAKASMSEGIEPNLINAIVWLESKFDPKAHNRSGARGLMQLMPTTSKAMAQALRRQNRPYDPDFSIHAGAHLVRVLLEKFEGDEQLALFGYARGSGRVRAWQKTREPLPTGVRSFIEKVERGRRTFEAMGFPGSAQTVCQKS